jgi:hypothetical protein
MKRRVLVKYLIQHGDPTKQTILADDETKLYEVPSVMIGLPEPDDVLPDEVAGPVSQRPKGITPYQGIRTQNYTYAEYVAGEKELYDLRKEPNQLQNIASMANAELLKELHARLTEVSKCSGANCRAAEDKPFTAK